MLESHISLCQAMLSGVSGIRKVALCGPGERLLLAAASALPQGEYWSPDERSFLERMIGLAERDVVTSVSSEVVVVARVHRQPHLVGLVPSSFAVGVAGVEVGHAVDRIRRVTPEGSCAPASAQQLLARLSPLPPEVVALAVDCPGAKPVIEVADRGAGVCVQEDAAGHGEGESPAEELFTGLVDALSGVPRAWRSEHTGLSGGLLRSGVAIWVRFRAGADREIAEQRLASMGDQIASMGTS